MRRRDINRINDMRIDGFTPTQISRELGISVNTIKSHIRRHPDIPGILFCRTCNKAVRQNPGRKAKHFCSDRCRSIYWNHKYRDKENCNGKQKHSA